MEERRASPVLMRWELGERLRELREASGMTGAEVAREVGWAQAKISRIENHGGVTPGDVRELLDVYGITSRADIQPMVQMARLAQQRGWWHTYGDVAGWFSTYLGLEAGAAEQRDYKGALITGLLQTRAYARAVISTAGPGGPADPHEIERAVALRMERQEVLLPPAPLRLHALMDIAATRRIVGGLSVMREQLHHLADMAQRPNITIQIVPDDQIHSGLEYPFTLLLFRESILPGLVYIENFTRSLRLEEKDDVAFYSTVFDRISRAALAPDQSRAVLLRQAEELGSERNDSGPGLAPQQLLRIQRRALR